MYGATTDLERSPGRERPGVLAWINTAEDIDVNCPDAPASGDPDYDGRKPVIHPDIAFPGGFGISRRALNLASRLATIRGIATPDELIAVGVLNADNYQACLAANLGLKFTKFSRIKT